MVFGYKQFSFNKVSSASGSTNTVSTTFQVKAVIVFTIDSGTVGSYLGQYRYSVGVSDGTTHRCTCTNVVDASDPMDIDSGIRNKVVSIPNNNATIRCEASVAFGGTNGLTFTWDTNDTSTPLIYGIALGDSDITNAAVIDIVSPGATGNFNTTVGFQGKFGFFVGPGSLITAAIPNIAGTHGGVTIGAATDATDQRCVTNANENAATAADTYHSGTNTNRVLMVSNGTTGAASFHCQFVAWTSTAVTLNANTITANARAFALILAGGKYKVGSFAGLVTGTPPLDVTAVTVTDGSGGAAFEPAGVFFNEVVKADTTATGGSSDARMGIGAAASSTDEFCVMWDDNDGGATAEVASRQENNRCIQALAANATHTSSTLHNSYDFKQMNSNGFQITAQTPITATTHAIFYIAFGPGGAALTRVEKQITLLYNIQGRVSKQNTLKYNIIGRVSKLNTLRYNIRLRVSKTNTLRYNILGRVSKLNTFRYNIIGRVSKVNTLRYNILGRTQKASTFIYNIRLRVSKANTLRYNILGRVQRTATFIYKIQGRVSKTLTSIYNIRGRTSRQTTYRYNILQRVTRPNTFLYHIFGRVSKGSTFRYSIQGRVSKPSTLRYNIVGRVSKASTFRYNILGRVSKLNTFIYNIASGALQRVSKQVTFKYNIIGRTQKQNTLIYNITGRVTKPTTLRYNILQRVSKQNTFIYKIAGRVQKPVTFLYNIIGRTQKPTTLRYNITSRVSKPNTFRYNITNRVQKITTFRYNIIGRVRKATTFVYNIIAEQVVPEPVPGIPSYFFKRERIVRPLITKRRQVGKVTLNLLAGQRLLLINNPSTVTLVLNGPVQPKPTPIRIVRVVKRMKLARPVQMTLLCKRLAISPNRSVTLAYNAVLVQNASQITLTIGDARTQLAYDRIMLRKQKVDKLMRLLKLVKLTSLLDSQHWS